MSQDENVRYVETEEELETPEFKFTGEAKAAQYHPAGTSTISTNPCQNGGGNRTAGRQDIKGTDHVTTPAER